MKKKVVVMMLMAAMCLGTACGQSSNQAAPAAQEEAATEETAGEAAEPAAEAAQEPAAETAPAATEPAAEAPAAEETAPEAAEEVEAPVSSKEVSDAVVATAKTAQIVTEGDTMKELPEELNQFKAVPTEGAAVNGKEGSGEATVEDAVEGAEAATGESEEAVEKLPEEGTEVLANQTITVNASSEYSDYNVMNLFDGDEMTAWSENVAGNGIGEYIEFMVPSGMYMDHFYIITGDQKSQESYWNNGAPTELCVVSGSQRQYISLWDEYGIWQSAEFDPIYSNGSIRIYITGVRPGAVYQDTCISEIWF